MKVYKFKDSNLKSINKWLKRHREPEIKLSELPETGLFVPGVGALFVRKCEGYVGLVDGLVTNPLVSAETRHKALEAIFNQLFEEPGFNSIIGFTLNDDTHKRCISRGFKAHPHKLLIYTRS
jgi:hypothetical protein